jgi:excinuclease UvrABC helicase subunit UvrB
MIPIILGQTFYQISALIDDVMFSNIMVGRDITKSISMDLGNFSSSYSLLIGIPQGVASAMSASMLPSVVASFTDKDMNEEELGIKLREAVEIENYEEAARLRDMIHQLKKMDNTDDSTQGGGHDA